MKTFVVVAVALLTACSHARTNAPLDFAVRDMNGHQVRLADYRGKPLVVNFWATWCGPCKLEMPQLVNLQKQYAAQGLTIVGINVDDDAPAVRTFANDFHVAYPMLIGADRADVRKAFGYDGLLPMSVFVRKDGTIAGRAIGIQTDDYWAKRVQALF